MHPYEVDQAVRTRVIVLSALVATVEAYFLGWILRCIPALYTWFIDYPSILGFFGLNIWTFNNVLWKTRLVQNADWLLIPNLTGTWDAEIMSSSDGFQTPIQSQITIKQTASKISISLITPTSISNSVHASVLPTGNPGNFELIYTYMNRPNADSPSTMNIHYGTAIYQVSGRGKILEGIYYTGRGRQTHGRVTLRQPQR
jgi:hypothetical protein